MAILWLRLDEKRFRLCLSAEILESAFRLFLYSLVYAFCSILIPFNNPSIKYILITLVIIK